MLWILNASQDGKRARVAADFGDSPISISRRLLPREMSSRVLDMLTNNLIDRLHRYCPRDLSERQWDLARLTAVTAVVATGVSTDESATVLLGHLARFLVWHPAWDRTASPDLEVLLRAPHVEAYVAASAKHRVARPYLHRVARAIGAIPDTTAVRRVKQRPAARRFWTTVVDLGSFTTLAEAYRRRGYAVMATIFEGLIPELTTPDGDHGHLIAEVASAREGELGTIGSAVRAAEELRVARDVEAKGVRVVHSTKAEPVKPKVAKPLSRTAAVRAAKAEIAQREAVRVSAVREHVEVGELPQLGAAIAGAVAAFRPHQFSDASWELVEVATRHLATAYEPPSVSWVRTQMGILARFCLWVASRPARPSPTEALRPAELLEGGLVEAYLAGPVAASPDSTRATVRSALRRAVRRLAPASAPQVISYQPVQPPYTPFECASLVRLARNQPTATLRRELSAIVALGLGAGLSSAEQRGVTRESVVEGELGATTALFVRVGGATPRTVVVRATYESLLREVLDLHQKAGRKPTDPLYGLSKARHNVTSPVTQRAKTALTTGVDVDSARLRSTWLVAAMSAPVPLGALLRASGLRSARTLVDLLAYCPSPDEAAVAAILRTYEERGNAVTS